MLPPHDLTILPPPITPVTIYSEVGGQLEPTNRIVSSALVAATRPRNALGLLGAMIVGICAWPVSMLLPYWLLGLGALYYGLGVSVDVIRDERRVRAGMPFTIMLRPEVPPEDVAAHDLRGVYLSILAAHDELRQALLAAPPIQDYLRGAFERCSAVVQSAGRLARLGNPIYRYDATHDRVHLQEEQQAAIASAESASDPLAARTYRDTAAARQRQLDTHDRLHDLRDRIRARLELIRATIETLVTLAVKLAVMDREQLELAGESLVGQLQSIHDEVAILEATLDEDVPPSTEERADVALALPLQECLG